MNTFATLVTPMCMKTVNIANNARDASKSSTIIANGSTIASDSKTTGLF